jgi:hypothetical protein
MKNFFFLALMIISFLSSCSEEGYEFYKVEYRENGFKTVGWVSEKKDISYNLGDSLNIAQVLSSECIILHGLLYPKKTSAETAIQNLCPAGKATIVTFPAVITQVGKNKE